LFRKSTLQLDVNRNGGQVKILKILKNGPNEGSSAMDTFRRSSITSSLTIDDKNLIGRTTPITREEKDESSKGDDEQ
jgi:hypothetical protein